MTMSPPRRNWRGGPATCWAGWSQANCLCTSTIRTRLRRRDDAQDDLENRRTMGKVLLAP